LELPENLENENNLEGSQKEDSQIQKCQHFNVTPRLACTNKN